MPRPRKCRRVCHFPQNLTFLPEEQGEGKETVFLTVDEYETIRLIDKEGLSPGTVQRLYAGCAHYRTADFMPVQEKSWQMSW